MGSEVYQGVLDTIVNAPYTHLMELYTMKLVLCVDDVGLCGQGRARLPGRVGKEVDKVWTRSGQEGASGQGDTLQGGLDKRASYNEV
jgi:hypothetical protein